jgi:hypothetical protein
MVDPEAEARISKIESKLKNFRIVGGDGVDISGDMSSGFSINTRDSGAGAGGGGGGGPTPPPATITVTVEDASGFAPGAGVPEVDHVHTLTFDSNMFEIYDGGGGQCVVKLKVCPATCPP